MSEHDQREESNGSGPLEPLAWELYDALADEEYTEAFSLWVELGRRFHAIYLRDPRVRAGWRKADLDPPQAAAC